MKQSKKDIFFEIIRFLIVGGIATIVDYIVFYVCNLLIFKNIEENANYIISTALGFTAGLITNWVLQKFVYRYLKDNVLKNKKIFLKFVILSLIGLGITEVGILLAKPLYDDVIINIFGKDVSVWKFVMKCNMTIIVLIINYIGRKFFVFRHEEKEIVNEDINEEN